MRRKKGGGGEEGGGRERRDTTKFTFSVTIERKRRRRGDPYRLLRSLYHGIIPRGEERKEKEEGGGGSHIQPAPSAEKIMAPIRIGSREKMGEEGEGKSCP